MNTKRQKLRLRKQVICCIPIVLLLTILSISLIIGKSGVLSNEVAHKITLSTTELDDTNQNDDFQLSDLEYIKKFTSMMEKRQKDNTIIYYATIFKLDVDKTLEIAKRYTKDYEDPSFNKTFIIGPTKVKKKLGKLKNFEAGAAYFARDLYRYPTRYGTTKEAIRIDNTITTKKITKGTIYMDNGLTFEQYLGKMCDLFEIDKEFTMAIVNLESGNKTSSLFRNKNNIGGHRGYNGWMSYSTLEAGIVAHVLSVKAIADNYDIDIKEVEETEISRFSGVYVNGKPTKPSASWTGKVNKMMNKLEKKDLFTIKE